MRRKYALKLMEEKRYNFSEIADQAGFNAHSYFTQSFKDQYGKAPSEYLEGTVIAVASYDAGNSVNNMFTCLQIQCC